jgi:hypothetical protein
VCSEIFKFYSTVFLIFHTFFNFSYIFSFFTDLIKLLSPILPKELLEKSLCRCCRDVLIRRRCGRSQFAPLVWRVSGSRVGFAKWLTISHQILLQRPLNIRLIPGELVDAAIISEIGIVQLRQRIQDIESDQLQTVVAEVDPLHLQVVLEHIARQILDPVPADVEVLQLRKHRQIVLQQHRLVARERENSLDIPERLLEARRYAADFDALHIHDRDIIVCFARLMTSHDMLDRHDTPDRLLARSALIRTRERTEIGGVRGVDASDGDR